MLCSICKVLASKVSLPSLPVDTHWLLGIKWLYPFMTWRRRNAPCPCILGRLDLAALLQLRVELQMCIASVEFLPMPFQPVAIMASTQQHVRVCAASALLQKHTNFMQTALNPSQGQSMMMLCEGRLKRLRPCKP